MQKLPGVSLPHLYSVVVNYVKDVGIYVAKLINILEDEGMNPASTTLIGHSLGAHIMGIAGFNAKTKVSYIVGTYLTFNLFVYLPSALEHIECI